MIFACIRFYIAWDLTTLAIWPFFRKLKWSPLAAWFCARATAPFLMAVLLMHVLTWGGIAWTPRVYWIVLLVLAVPAALLSLRERSLHLLHYRSLLRAELLFLVFFILLVLVFGFHYGGSALGERPMDLGLVSSLWTTPGFPPRDFWLAGENLNTYYLGSWSYAALGRAAFVLPYQAYFFGLALVWIQTIAACLLAGRILKIRGKGNALIPFLALLMGNGASLYHLVRGLSPFHPNFILSLSRIIPYTINENPAVAFWVSELHAHVMALPLLIVYFILLYSGLSKKKISFLLASSGAGALVFMTDAWLVIPVLAGTLCLLILNMKRCQSLILKSVIPCLGVAFVVASAFIADFKGYPFRLLPVNQSTTRVIHLLVLFGPMVALFLVNFPGTMKNHKVRGSALAFVSAALLLILFCEFWYVDNRFPSPGERQNTIFRFHYAAWVFLFLGVCMTWQGRGKAKGRYVFSWVIVLFFFVVGAVLPGIIRMIRMRPLFTMDLRQALDKENSGRIEAAEWLFDHSPPDAVLAESAGDPYRLYATVSAMSGRPAVLGEVDKVQNHAADISLIRRRLQDLQTIYLDLPQTAEILKKYRVKYIILGPKEMEAFPGCRRESLLRKHRMIYHSGSTDILQVEQVP